MTALALVAAPSAGAQSDLYNDFQADGQIDACAYSPGQLQNGLDNLPPDLQQYAPGFGDQLRAGLEASCGGGAVPAPGDESGVSALPGGAGGGPPTATRVNTPAAPKPTDRPVIGNVASPAVGAVPGGSDPPGWLLPALVGAALLFAAMAMAAMRAGGFGLEGLTRPLRASFSDAGGRTSDAFAYARDVVRYGR